VSEAPVEPYPRGELVRRWGFTDVAITLLGTIVLGTLVASLALAVTHPGTTGRAWANVVLLVAPWIVLGGWPVYASRTRGDGPVKDFGLRLTGRGALTGFVGGIAALLLAQLVAWATEAISGHPFDSAVGALASDMTTSRGALVVLGLCTIFGAPVVEELAFRGLTFGAFVRLGQPVPLSVLWSSLLFAMFHFELIRLPLLLVIGLVLGTVRAYTGSTAASMVAHATVNLAAGLTIMTMH
jgi:membrane protease YdiL (CAAX protease family)